MTTLGHGHDIDHAYVVGRPTISEGHGAMHGYVTAARPKHEIPADGPMTLRYVRNPGTSKSHGNFGEQYGQHVEPHGRYLSERSGDHAPEGWETGEVHFHNPLHIPFGGGYTEPSNWKHQLSDRYDGKRGRALSKAVAKDGHDAIVTHDDYGTSEIVDLTHLHKRGAKEPDQRLFGKTFGLDHRLFEGEHLRPEVRAAVLAKFDDFATHHNFDNWRGWGKLVFFGSEASEWTSADLEGNGDFDLSFGIDYLAFRRRYPGFGDETDAEIAQEFTERMHAELNDPNCMIAGEGPFDQTWFCNEQGYDIEKIKPYAAYDVGADAWIVKPPHLPDWDISQFPQGHALVQEAHAVAAYVRAVLALPEPFRSQQATALWEHLHSDRSRAFGEQGEGWYDSGNVIEKFLDQLGLWQKLVDARMQARDHPEMLATPSGWSNDPHSPVAGSR